MAFLKKSDGGKMSKLMMRNGTLMRLGCRLLFPPSVPVAVTAIVINIVQMRRIINEA
jgi:hypothetical protein